MSKTFLFLIAQGRISPYLVFLILLLPIIITLVAFARQVVGVKMYGAFAPIIATYAFLGTGLIPGLLISLLIFATSIILRISTKSLRAHYLPRTAVLMTLISLVVIIVLPFSIYLPFVDFTKISATSVILFVVLSDIYLTSEIQSGYKIAGRLYIETIVVSALIYLLVSWQLFQQTLIHYPEIVILALFADIVMGRWKGLRLTEIYRFHSVIKSKAKEL